MMKYPNLIVSDCKGQIFEIPEYYMAGLSLQTPVLPEAEELIPLPHGSDLYRLPHRIPIGYDPQKKKFIPVPKYRGEPVFAVAAFMAPAYIQFYRSAYESIPGAPRLPLYSYTAAGWMEGRFYVTARRIDPDMRQDLSNFHLGMIDNEARLMLERYPGNRLVQHLVENCVFRYGCPAARNFSLGRWECPIPVSSGCNAACVGCISEQSQETGITSPQDRINFIPTVEEIAEFTVPHLENAPRPVVSFGQGCEGEPLLAGSVIEEAIRKIRRRTDKGIININTNASRPDIIERLCQAGLNSIRVSLNSAQKHFYEAYYRPRHYAFEDVVESLKIIRKYGRWASINYFIFPGFTDHPSEMAALKALIDTVQLNMIQTRNLNIDPDWYMDELGLGELDGQHTGVAGWLVFIRKKFPQIQLGYFNPPQEEILKSSIPFL